MVDGIRLAVIDDHPLLREGVVSILSREPGFEVVCEGTSAADAVAIAERLRPDVLLLDVSIPGGGIEAARTIATSCPEVKVVMLTVAEDEETVTSALRSGARGYILKGVSGPDLIATIWRTHRGESYISPDLAARLLAQMAPADGASRPNDGGGVLSSREKEILELVVRGISYEQIGRDLGLSQTAIKGHMSHVLQKLGTHNREIGRPAGQARA
jgi:two-component system, NarL family, nitrate/nitrite response regulator NarL